MDGRATEQHGRSGLNWLSRLWCRHFHRRVLWPIHGKYHCAECLREWPVLWNKPDESHGLRVVRTGERILAKQ